MRVSTLRVTDQLQPESAIGTLVAVEAGGMRSLSVTAVIMGLQGLTGWPQLAAAGGRGERHPVSPVLSPLDALAPAFARDLAGARHLVWRPRHAALPGALPAFRGKLGCSPGCIPGTVTPPPGPARAKGRAGGADGLALRSGLARCPQAQPTK
jgi:hypothetical protein